MPHNLEIRDGRAAMMHVVEPPWQGLGVELDRPATAAEAIRAAGLDWRVSKAPLEANLAGTRIAVKDRFAIVRRDRLYRQLSLFGGAEEPDPNPILGIVGDQYTPLQNEDAFAFFDPIVERNAAIYHTAGSLGNGERIWILAKLPGCIRVAGDDIAEKFLLLASSHNGSSAVQVKFTPIRVVCQNTLTMALNQGRTLRITHTRNLHYRLLQAERLLGLITQRFQDIEATFKAMASVQMDRARLSEYMYKVFPDPADPDDERGRRRATEHRRQAEHWFAHGAGNSAPPAAGTLWAAYNAVAEYVDHHMPYLSADRYLNAIWFADGYLAKSRAYEVGAAWLEVWQN